MNYSDYRFTLDITNTLQAQVSVPCTLGDSARRLYIGLTEGRKPYELANGCRAVFAAKKPDGTTIFNDCIIEGNKTIVYEFSKNTASAEGVVDCEIRLYGTNGKLITSPQFIIVVDKRVVRDEEILSMLSESEHTALDDMIESEAQRLVNEAERVLNEAERQEAYAKINSLYGVNGAVSLPASGWVDGKQTVTIPNVGEDDFITFFPATSNDNFSIVEHMVYCDVDALDGVVTFHCDTAPAADISLRYYINRSAGGEA
ncbi:MAG: BppU family phage baseplate upper protein [Clostridia bacterium]|nr:BppU family phage baseplate upper protein [Clostridia bacterium]